MKVRQAKPQESAHLLTAVENSNVLDSVSAEMTLANLAAVQKMQGDEASAAATISRMSEHSSRKATAESKAR